MFYTVS